MVDPKCLFLVQHAVYKGIRGY